MGDGQKLLVRLVDQVSETHVFFLASGLLTLFFVRVFIKYYQRQTRRNFRDPSSGPKTPPRVDNRRLKD